MWYVKNLGIPVEGVLERWIGKQERERRSRRSRSARSKSGRGNKNGSCEGEGEGRLGENRVGVLLNFS